MPLGDDESLKRLRQRADDLTARPAGSTALAQAKLAPADESRPA